MPPPPEGVEVVNVVLGYADRGWPVLPLVPGDKRPLAKLVPHGMKDATTDPSTIRRWWRAAPKANVGLVTGIAFDVLDIDGPEALDRLSAVGPLESEAIEGPTVATPRGWHAYVARTGRGNTVRLGGIDGVDWRGAGGYVVAPPSSREDGATWSWITTSPLDRGADTPIVSAPAWLFALFNRPADKTWRSQVPHRHAGRTGHGAAALERELGRLVVAQEGARNHQLNRSAYALGRFIPGGALTAQEVGDALLAMATRIGLRAQEAIATIRSGLVAGVQNPRTPRRSF